jgi:hypothetical protein
MHNETRITLAARLRAREWHLPFERRAEKKPFSVLLPRTVVDGCGNDLTRYNSHALLSVWASPTTGFVSAACVFGSNPG